MILKREVSQLNFILLLVQILQNKSKEVERDKMATLSFEMGVQRSELIRVHTDC